MANIEQITTDLLNQYDMMTAPIDVKALIKKLKIKLELVDFGDEISGVLVTEKGKTKIGYSKNESSQRQRFTLAHELGHFILHVKDSTDKLFVDNVKVMYRKQAFTRTEKMQEVEANQFAASLLMPKDIVMERYNHLINKNSSIIDDEIVTELSGDFKVSQLAMNFRLSNLGLIEPHY
jgi:Zn-dependent peptidase ImmA (M78 family)